ncbi:MAG: O-antigen ligase family protein [Candidatus Hatepunaea meridiana]|nr:O-antigen ligase family protein [Candidatus Hatepunaea meridiana]
MKRKILNKSTQWTLLLLAALQIYSLPLQQVLAGLLIILGVWYGLTLFEKGENVHVRRIGYAFLLFMIFRMVSVLHNLHLNNDIRDLQFPLLAMVFLAVIGWSKYMDVKRVKRVESVWFWMVVIACVIGIFKYIIGFETRIGPPFGARIIHSDSLAEGNYSTFAKFLTITLLYFGIGWLKTVDLRRIRLQVVGVCLIGCGLLLTFSRGCWLAVAAVFTGLMVKERPKLVGLILIGVALLVLSIPYARERIMQSLSPSDWSSGRAELWQVAFDRSQEQLFLGFGLGSFDAIVTPEIKAGFPDKGVGDWHNQYIQIFMENGLIGLLLFGWLIFELFAGYRWLLKNTTDKDAVRFAWGGIAMLCGFLVFSMFTTTLDSPTVNISFWCLSGLSVGWIQWEHARTTI